MNSYENEFLKFDTVKIRTKKEYLKNTLIEFNKNYSKHGDLTGICYNSKNDKSIPYNLFVGVNYNSQSLTIEFSSKVLLDDYPKLITQKTFRQCLENINNLGICTIDIDKIANDCYFSKVHVTNDINYMLTNDILNFLNSCVGNYRRYKWLHYEGQGLSFTKDVKSRCCQESLTIYDKEQEIEKNKDFLFMLQNPQNVIDYFKGVTRFEMNLDSPKKICSFLNITSTHITNIFSSDVNPLLKQFNKIFGEKEVESKYSITNYEDYAMKTIIEKHNGDLKKIEQEMKDLQVYSSNSRSGLNERMKKIKHLLFEMNNTSKPNNILGEFRQLLEEKHSDI